MMMHWLANATFAPSVFVSSLVFLLFASVFCFCFFAFWVSSFSTLAICLIYPRIMILGMRVSMAHSSVFEENRAPTIMSLHDCLRRIILTSEE